MTQPPPKKITEVDKEILRQTLIAEEAPDLSLAEKLREKKKVQKKKNIKRGSILAFLVFFAWFIWWGFAPFRGTVPFALCKILLELNVPYPNTLRYTETNILRSGAVRIWFTHVDPFGIFRMESFSCTFAQDPDTQNSIIAQAKWGNLDIEPAQLETFNKVMPFLVAGNFYDTTAPAPLADSLQDLKFEVDNFRKVKLLNIMSTMQE
jgi:hypothetical protein